MTALKYLIESKVGTSSEIIAFKLQDPKGFETLREWAKNEMLHNGIEITEK